MFACRYAPDLVNRVVKDVLDCLGRPALHVADIPVDLAGKVKAIKEQLAARSVTGSAVMGLHCMGGIGKTTLARAVLNDLRSGFVSHHCFVEVGRQQLDQAADRQQLQQKQQQVLSELCGVTVAVNSVAAGRMELEKRLRDARVLLVIDNVWSTDQLDALLVNVGQGSCVLVTTLRMCCAVAPPARASQALGQSRSYGGFLLVCVPPEGASSRQQKPGSCCSGGMLRPAAHPHGIGGASLDHEGQHSMGPGAEEAPDCRAISRHQQRSRPPAVGQAPPEL